MEAKGRGKNRGMERKGKTNMKQKRRVRSEGGGRKGKESYLPILYRYSGEFLFDLAS